jgi:hypothetical protein
LFGLSDLDFKDSERRPLSGFPMSGKASSRSPSRQGKPKGPSDELNKELFLLEIQRAQAIADCDFVKARALDCHLDRLKEEHVFTRTSSKQVQLELALNLKKESLRLQAAKDLQEARDRIFTLQRDFQSRLIDLHRIHSDELVAFAQEYATALELESTRAVPDAVYLKRQAQFNAKHRNYVEAEALFEQSKQARIEQTERRQSDLKHVFNLRKGRIVARQEGEVELCLDKQRRELEVIEKNFEKRIAVLRSSLTKTAADLGVGLAPDDFAFFEEFSLSAKPESPTPKPSPGTPSRPRTPGSGSKRNETVTPRKSPKISSRLSDR